jgi:5-(carboxyamino)imidazole ribonucleotide synthase
VNVDFLLHLGQQKYKFLKVGWYIWQMKQTNPIPIIGILGGGQLGRMFIQNAIRYDAEIFVMDPDPSAPCAQLASKFVLGNINDFETVIEFGRTVDVLTVEIEHVNSDALRQLENEGVSVYPQSSVLSLIQHKGKQKDFYKEFGIPTSPYVFIESRSDIESLDDSWFPCFQKLFTSGYDGKGVKRLNSKADLSEAFDAPSLLEKLVDLKMEFAVMVSGHAHDVYCTFPAVDMVFHPEANLVEFLSAPSALPTSITDRAEKIAKEIALRLNIRGILAIEFFLDQNDEIIVNEMAPRPHNSGHHTIQGNVVSQFEQHFRSIVGWAPGDTSTVKPAVMLNVLGEPGYSGAVKYVGLEEISAIPGVNVHLYGKKITKPYRKMGHVTVTADSTEEAMQIAHHVKSIIKVIA